ncbi:MAG: hypothetical protein QW734_05925 [Candidatus Bathyarchaeia archaeon]
MSCIVIITNLDWLSINTIGSSLIFNMLATSLIAFKRPCAGNLQTPVPIHAALHPYSQAETPLPKKFIGAKQHISLTVGL